jgi:hypothetical protein
VNHEHDDELSRLRAEVECLRQELAEAEARLAELQAEGRIPIGALLQRLRPGQRVSVRRLADDSCAVAFVDGNTIERSEMALETSAAIRSALLQLPSAPLSGEGWRVVPGSGARLTAQEYAAHYFGVRL